MPQFWRKAAAVATKKEPMKIEPQKTAFSRSFSGEKVYGTIVILAKSSPTVGHTKAAAAAPSRPRLKMKMSPGARKVISRVIAFWGGLGSSSAPSAVLSLLPRFLPLDLESSLGSAASTTFSSAACAGLSASVAVRFSWALASL